MCRPNNGRKRRTAHQLLASRLVLGYDQDTTIQDDLPKMLLEPGSLEREGERGHSAKKGQRAECGTLTWPLAQPIIPDWTRVVGRTTTDGNGERLDVFVLKASDSCSLKTHLEVANTSSSARTNFTSTDVRARSRNRGNSNYMNAAGKIPPEFQPYPVSIRVHLTE
ncbi:hypothetical protein C8R44DRAFT_726039 [Mycena epipterygia]|nr:hypothetical protein C8R44DRAFT_726039 [Mycena epipterygia]